MAHVLRIVNEETIVMSPANTERSSSFGNFDARAETEVEDLIADIGGIIRSTDPEKRAGLKELAETLLHEEISTIAEGSTAVAGQMPPPRFNPLAPGILVMLLALGFLLIFPVVGVTLASIGVVLMVWGGVMSWFKK